MYEQHTLGLCCFCELAYYCDYVHAHKLNYTITKVHRFNPAVHNNKLQYNTGHQNCSMDMGSILWTCKIEARHQDLHIHWCYLFENENVLHYSTLRLPCPCRHFEFLEHSLYFVPDFFGCQGIHNGVQTGRDARSKWHVYHFDDWIEAEY